MQQGSTWSGFPAGTVMGHIHFHVADLEEAKRFYVDGLGFEVTIPARNGALFVSAGGYHHHIGLNTWQGEGVPPQMPGSVGLKYFTIVLADEKQKEQVCESLKILVRLLRTKMEYYKSRIHLDIVSISNKRRSLKRLLFIF